MLEVLGVGGSGVVYAAYDRELRRKVALKVLRSDRMTESALKRFRREVAVARDVHSPYLVRVFDIAQTAESTYLTMELVEGRSLASLIEAGPLSIEQATAVAKQILLALEALHRVGIVHRDVKPSNVMLGPDGRVKLTDFGLARPIESDTRATESEAVVGTYEYLSPEQALCEPIDERSDLYSLGVLLYECLTGDVPLRQSSALGTVIAHVRATPPDVRATRPEVPGWVAAIVRKLLEKGPRNRYQTAADVAKDLAEGRAPARRMAGLILTAVVATILVTLTGLLATFHRDSRSRFAKLTEGGARDAAGEILWRDERLLPGVNAAAVSTAGGGSLVAAILADDLMRPTPQHELRLLDGESGTVRDRMVLSGDMGSFFSGFSNCFRVSRMLATDVDHDGNQEVVISFHHDPWYPSYTYFVDVENRRAYCIFIASGHHDAIGTLDVDADGRDELILWGPNNRMGWHRGLAAVRVDRQNEWRASTPDSIHSVESPGALVWYALVGNSTTARASVDQSAHQVIIESSEGTLARLGMDGFPVGTSMGPRDVSLRTVGRESAYTALREGLRLSSAGERGPAFQRIDEALANARRARDSTLVQWLSRVKIRLLVAHSDRDALPSIVGGLTGSQASRDDCWEIATAAHLRGETALAVEWYRRGVLAPNHTATGRFTSEYVEGLVFALGELGRWEEARQIVAAHEALRDPRDRGIDYQRWIEWRTDPDSLPCTEQKSRADLWRYLELECRVGRRTETPPSLLALTEERGKTVSGVYRWLVLSVRSELLAAQGKNSEALETARQAFVAMREALHEDIAARAHFDLVARRFERAAIAAGQQQEALQARSELEAFSRRPDAD